jgi:hypothetical protein
MKSPVAMPADPMLSIAQLALLLNISKRQAQNLCDRGRIPAKNVGLGRRSCWRVKMSDALRFMDTPDNDPQPLPFHRVPSLPPHIRRRV